MLCKYSVHRQEEHLLAFSREHRASEPLLEVVSVLEKTGVKQEAERMAEKFPIRCF